MALVSLLERDDVPPEVQAAFDGGTAQFGRLLHTWQAIAHRPDTFVAYLPYLRSVAGPGVVEQRVKELTAVEVTLVNHCPYSCSHRVKAATAAGVTEHELRALADQRYEEFTSREQLALALAREMTLGPAALSSDELPAAVTADVLDQARREFTEPQLVELTLNISLWNALTRFHRVMQFDYDLDPPPEFMEARL